MLPHLDEPDLHRATSSGDLNRVRHVIYCGVDVNARGRYGWTPLHRAAKQDNVELAQLLLNLRAAVDSRCYDDETPLMVAVRESSLRVARLLVQNDAGVHKEDSRQRSPMWHACQVGRRQFIPILLSCGANANRKIVTRDGPKTPLHHIVCHPNGRTTSHSTQWIPAVLSLLDHGADISTRDLKGDTPLHCVAKRNDAAAAQFLVAHNGDVNARNYKCSTPLHMATGAEVVEFLVANDANMQARDYRRNTALHHAAMTNAVETVQALMAAVVVLDDEDVRAYLLIKNLSGRTAFQEAKTLETANAMLETLSGRGDRLLTLCYDLLFSRDTYGQTLLDSTRHKLLLYCMDVKTARENGPRIRKARRLIGYLQSFTATPLAVPGEGVGTAGNGDQRRPLYGEVGVRINPGLNTVQRALTEAFLKRPDAWLVSERLCHNTSTVCEKELIDEIKYAVLGFLAPADIMWEAVVESSNQVQITKG